MATLSTRVTEDNIEFQTTIVPDALGTFSVHVHASWTDPDRVLAGVDTFLARKTEDRWGMALSKSRVAAKAEKMRARLVKEITEQYLTVEF